MRIYEYKIIKTSFSFLVLVFFDQLSKYIIRTQSGFYICNKEAAFGIPFVYIFLILIMLACILSVVNLKFQIPNFSLFEIISVILILSGGLSNIIDRIYFGCVIDFINLKIWPVFNLADIYITIGAIILIFSYVIKSSFGGDHRP